MDIQVLSFAKTDNDLVNTVRNYVRIRLYIDFGWIRIVELRSTDSRGRLSLRKAPQDEHDKIDGEVLRANPGVDQTEGRCKYRNCSGPTERVEAAAVHPFPHNFLVIGHQHDD
jgi:hypothetical protein